MFEEIKENQNIPEYLKKDILFNIDMIEPIRRGQGKVIYESENGVVMYEKNSDTMFFSVADFGEFKEQVDKLDFSTFSLAVTHSKKQAEYISSIVSFPEQMEVYQYVYTGGHIDFAENHFIRLADKNNDDEVRFIASHYSGVSGYDYTRSRVDEGNVYVKLSENNEIMGFVGFHEEGSMGILEVMQEYRRQGIATELMGFIIKEAKRRGYVPFSQAETDNYKSMALHEKMGMTRAENPVYWLIRD